MTTLLVTAIEESTGKTAIALALATLAKERGRTVGYMKPKGTRLESHVGKTLDSDPMLARDLLDLDAAMHELEPVVYSPTFIQGAIRGHEDPDELRATVKERFDGLAADRDLMVLEGGGSLTTGGIVNLTDPEVANLLDAQVILIAAYDTPGDVDDVLAAADRVGDRLAGVVFNAVADADYDVLSEDVVPFLESRGIDVPGVIPYTRDLAGVTVGELASELGAEVVTDTPTDAYVERFLVGAMAADSALRFFRRTKDAAVITGGDRADIQTAALEAPGVKCLILTGGFRPPGAVVGKAEGRGVPILSVRSDTLATVERAEDVVRSGRTRDSETVAVMRGLLQEHALVDPLLGHAADEE